MGAPPITWPGGHRFAFTIFDDTDWTTLDNGPMVYELLTGLGMRVTKSVWPVAPTRHRSTGGGTCAEPEYLAWVRGLIDRGHEVGIHDATDHPSTRAETVAALDRFAELFGHDPKVSADHAGNREALYLGRDRLSGWRAAAYGAAQRVLQPQRPQWGGHVPTSEYFWGDVCRDRITYHRGFTFAETNVLRACPTMPYHDPARGYVNHWFASTDAPRCADVVRRLAPGEIDRLEAEGGVCILYTHLGLDVVVDGVIDPGFVAVMESLAARNAWFAPVGEVLDHLRASPCSGLLDDRSRRRLENRWVADRLRHARRIGPRVQTLG